MNGYANDSIRQSGFVDGNTHLCNATLRQILGEEAGTYS